MIKVLGTLGIDGTYFKILKTLYNKLTVNNILNKDKQKIFSKVRNKTKMSTHCSLVCYSDIAISIRQEKTCD